MHDAVKLPLTFSIETMLSELKLVESVVWRPVLASKGANWSGAALRSHDGKPGTMDYRGSCYQDTPLLAGMPYFQEVLASFKCDLCRVRILAMQPGASIGQHSDALPAESQPQVRLHLPLITNDQVDFTIEGRIVKMGAGELWFLDVTRQHSVVNRGVATRIHLVLDCVVNEWLDAILASGVAT